MKKSIVYVAAVLSLMIMAGCRSENDASASQAAGQREEQTAREVAVPEIQVYPLGKVSESLCREFTALAFVLWIFYFFPCEKKSYYNVGMPVVFRFRSCSGPKPESLVDWARAAGG